MGLKADDVVSVIIARSSSWLTSMQLQKLLYYVQSWHLAVTDRPLFEEQVEAWQHGPVVPEVWAARKDPSSRRADPVRGNVLQLTDTASGIIDLVLAAYGSMSGDELSQLTHVEWPWLEARAGLPATARCDRVISRDSMANFAREHRRLGGRTAADLAAGGVHVRTLGGEAPSPLDVDNFLGGLGPGFWEPREDADLVADADDSSTVDLDGIETTARRAYAAS